MSRWATYIAGRLAALRRGDGDFAGLRQPTAQTVDRAEQVAADLFRDNTPTPSLVPSPEGTVLFVWHKAGWWVEIVVGPDEVDVWAHHSESQATFHGRLDDNRQRVCELLDSLGATGTAVAP